MTDYPTTTCIVGKFFYGNMGDFKIIINTENNTINITKLCKGGGKRFVDWKKNANAEELIKYYHSYVGCDNYHTQHNCCVEVTSFEGLDVDKKTADLLRGTYVPDLIAIQVAQWISPEYAIKVSMIVKEHEVIQNYILKIKNEELNEKNKSLLERIDIIRAENRVMYAEAEVKNEARHNKIMSRFDSMYDELVKNPTDIPEAVAIIQDPTDSNIYWIKGGRKDYINKVASNSSSYRIFKNISNAKRAIRLAKKEGYIPMGHTSKYNIKDLDMRKIKKLFRTLDKKYEEDKKKEDGFQTALEE